VRYVPRALEETLRRAMRTFPAVLLTGPRQSGKTTLLRERFGHSHHYVSLDRPDIRQRALADPVTFLEENGVPAIIDEIQHVPELLSYVKERVDVDRRPGRWLLTGSQSLALMRGVSETLAGRVAVLTLDPLSVTELPGHATSGGVDQRLARVFGEERSLPRRTLVGPHSRAHWLLRGAFPEVRLRPRVDRRLWLASYVQTYLERDVRDLLRVGDLTSFGRFLTLVAARNAGLLNLADLGRDAGVTGPTVRSWLGVLEATQLVYLLRPHHASLGKRLVKSPKLYLLDTGLATHLLGLHTPESVLHGAYAGPLLETAVVAEWIKLFRQGGEEPPLSFWRSSGGEEVDLVVERDDRLYGIEVKATATPAPQHAAALGRWLERSGPRARGVVACCVPAPGALRRAIRAVPWHPW
jgi:predicted AAA+ superfamily ATPase